MQELEDFLSYVVTHVDGALFAALGGNDGLLVEQYPKDEHNLSAFTAELTNVLVAFERLNSNGLDGGELRETMTIAERSMSYTRVMSKELFLFVIMNPSGNLGKARLYSDHVSAQILDMFGG